MTMPLPIRRAVLSAALATPLLAAQAQVTVQNGNGTTQVSITSYDPRPAAVTLEYTVTCALPAQAAGDPHSYLIRVAQGQVSFSPDNDIHRVRDISASRFGALLASRALQGRYAFVCEVDGLLVDFIGFQAIPGAGAPRPVSYRVLIQNDGSFRPGEDAQLQAQSYEFVNSHLIP